MLKRKEGKLFKNPLPQPFMHENPRINIKSMRKITEIMNDRISNTNITNLLSRKNIGDITISRIPNGVKTKIFDK